MIMFILHCKARSLHVVLYLHLMFRVMKYVVILLHSSGTCFYNVSAPMTKNQYFAPNFSAFVVELDSRVSSSTLWTQ